MRTLWMIVGFLVILIPSGCKNEVAGTEFVFVNDYCTTIIVGGVVGVKQKCFNKSDQVLAESITDSSIVIRIAEPSVLNNEPGPSSYQELLEIPLEHVVARK